MWIAPDSRISSRLACAKAAEPTSSIARIDAVIVRNFLIILCCLQVQKRLAGAEWRNHHPNRKGGERPDARGLRLQSGVQLIQVSGERGIAGTSLSDAQ